MVATVSLSRCIQVQCPESKAAWVITDTETISGVEFVTLNVGDSGFAKFIAGSQHGIRNCQFLSDMKKMRLDSTCASVNASASALFGDSSSDSPASQNTEYIAKRQRKQVVDTASKGVMPSWIEMALPDIDVDGGEVVPGITLKVKPALKSHAPLTVELNVQNLTYIRAACIKSLDAISTPPRARVGDNKVRWRNDRHGWLAIRHGDGITEQKGQTTKCHIATSLCTRPKLVSRKSFRVSP